jgi:hypothetical protein
MEKNNQDKKEITLDDLARITQKGLLSIDEKLENVEKKLDKIETDVSVLKTDVTYIKSTVDNIEANLNKKVDKVDHNTLTYRVEKLEKKFA